MPIQQNSYNVLFISEQTLKDRGIINENVDAKVILPVIKAVQFMEIQEAIGTPLMSDLMNKISSNTLNSDEKYLLDFFLAEAMSWLVASQGVMYNTLKFQNKGLEKMSSDSSQPASLDEMQAYRDDARNKGDFWLQRTIDHLNANPGLFPAYSTSPFGLDDILPNKNTPYNTGIYLGPDYGTKDTDRKLYGGIDYNNPYY